MFILDHLPGSKTQLPFQLNFPQGFTVKDYPFAKLFHRPYPVLFATFFLIIAELLPI